MRRIAGAEELRAMGRQSLEHIERLVQEREALQQRVRELEERAARLLCGLRDLAKRRQEQWEIIRLQEADRNRLDEQVRELAAENARLRETLRPFAQLLHRRHRALPDGHPVYQMDEVVVTVGDIRRAKQALEGNDGA